MMNKAILFLYVAALFCFPYSVEAVGQNRVPDDCLGTWDDCASLRLEHGRFDSRAFEYLPLPPLGNQVDCEKAKNILVRQQFSRVQIIDCISRVYTFIGTWEGHAFRIAVSSRTGHILKIE